MCEFSFNERLFPSFFLSFSCLHHICCALGMPLPPCLHPSKPLPRPAICVCTSSLYRSMIRTISSARTTPRVGIEFDISRSSWTPARLQVKDTHDTPSPLPVSIKRSPLDRSKNVPMKVLAESMLKCRRQEAKDSGWTEHELAGDNPVEPPTNPPCCLAWQILHLGLQPKYLKSDRDQTLKAQYAHRHLIVNN